MGDGGRIVIIIDIVVHGGDSDDLSEIRVRDRKRQGSRFNRYVVGISAGNANDDVSVAFESSLMV